MSRTEKTQPFDVQLWDGTLRKVAVHDHRDGICDLPDSLIADRAAPRIYSAYVGNCRWDFDFTGTYICSCEMCRPSRAYRRRKRGRRRLIRMQLRAEQAAWNASGDCTDEFITRARTWYQV